MNKKTIIIGIGVVLAFLVYKKFKTPTETKSTEADEQPAAEEESAGGGGGGGGAAAGAAAGASANKGIGGAIGAASSVKKGMATKELGKIKPSSVMAGITAVQKPRNFGTAQSPTRPLTPIARPQLTPAPKIAIAPQVKTARFVGFLDIENRDVQGEIM